MNKDEQYPLPTITHDLHPQRFAMAAGALIGVFGCGGCARDVMPLVEAIRLDAAQACFVDRAPETSKLNGYDVLSEQEFMQHNCGPKFFLIAINDSRIRERIAKNLEGHATPLSIAPKSSPVYHETRIDEGTIISEYCLVGSNVTIGKHVHINMISSVSHDCILRDYVTLAPRVTCNGNVTIEDHAYIGAGATIKQGIKIGAGATVGMGAVIIRDVPSGQTVVGNPGRPLLRRS